MGNKMVTPYYTTLKMRMKMDRANYDQKSTYFSRQSVSTHIYFSCNIKSHKDIN